MLKKIFNLSLAAGILCAIPAFSQTGQHDPGSLDMMDSKSTQGKRGIIPCSHSCEGKKGCDRQDRVWRAEHCRDASNLAHFVEQF